MFDLTLPQVLVKRTTGVRLRPSAMAIAEFQFPWWQHSIATSIKWSITFAAFEVFDARQTWLAVKADRELNLKLAVNWGHFEVKKNSPISPIVQCISRLFGDEVFCCSGFQVTCFDMCQSWCHFESGKVCYKWFWLQRFLWESCPKANFKVL